MTDCVLVQDGRAHQVFADTTKQDLCFRLHEGESEPRAIFPREMIDAIVEVDAGMVKEGAAYADGAFTNPPAPRRLVPKSLIIDRLNAAGKLSAAKTALDANLYARERWYAPDKPAVYADDPETLALLQAIGVNAGEILAA